MKVIFLDNDGVICLANNWGGRSKKWSKYRSANPESILFKNEAPVDVRFDDFDQKSALVCLPQEHYFLVDPINSDFFRCDVHFDGVVKK